MLLDIRNIDCMELMKEFEDNHFDLAICDPPYSETFNTDACADNMAKKGNYNIATLNGYKPNEDYFKELKRVSKNQIIWGANWFGYFGVGGICWFKDNTGNYSPCEYAYQSFNNHIHHYKFRWNGMLQEDMKNKQVRIHPTEKPKQLYTWLLKKFAKENDKILDTHLGSGSIALAIDSVNKIERLNLSLTASEIEPTYYTEALKRIEQLTAQTSLFSI